MIRHGPRTIQGRLPFRWWSTPLERSTWMQCAGASSSCGELRRKLITVTLLACANYQ